jgi:uncharacterized protein with HEPN domain
MPPEDPAEHDRVRLVHMLEAACEAAVFARGKTRADLDQDRLLVRGLTSCLQEIGEAASRVSEASRARAPSIPWTRIIGMRHRLVHVVLRR